MKTKNLGEALSIARKALIEAEQFHEKSARQLYADARGGGFSGLSQNVPGKIDGMTMIQHDRAAKKAHKLRRAIEEEGVS